MRTIRRRLSRTIIGWLCCQLLVLTVAPVSLCAMALPAHDRPAHSASDCHCGGTSTDTSALAVASMFGSVAVLTPASDRAATGGSSSFVALSIAHARSWVPVPDSPPPRL